MWKTSQGEKSTQTFQKMINCKIWLRWARWDAIKVVRILENTNHASELTSKTGKHKKVAYHQCLWSLTFLSIPWCCSSAFWGISCRPLHCSGCSRTVPWVCSPRIQGARETQKSLGYRKHLAWVLMCPSPHPNWCSSSDCSSLSKHPWSVFADLDARSFSRARPRLSSARHLQHSILHMISLVFHTRCERKLPDSRNKNLEYFFFSWRFKIRINWNRKNKVQNVNIFYF